MLHTNITRFPHVKPADTAWRSDGLRDFFLSRTWAWPTPPQAG